MAAAVEVDGNSSRSGSLDTLDRPMRVTTPVGWLLTAVLLAAIVVGTVWSALVQVPITVKGSGILHAGGVEDIVSPARGTLLRLLPAIGSTVRAGDLVAEIEQPDLSGQIALREAALREAEKRQEELKLQQNEMISAYKAQADAKTRAAREKITQSSQRLEWLREREVGFDELMKTGSLTRDRWLQLKGEIAGVIEGITAARNDLVMASTDGQLRDAERDRLTLQVVHEVSQIRSELDGLRLQYKNNSEIRSRYNGKVVELKVHEGDFVTQGQPLFEVILHDKKAMRDHTLVGVVFVSQRDGKRIDPGMEVQVAVASIDRSEYGFIVGRVHNVNEFPLSSAGLQAIVRNDQMVRTITQQYGAPFEITVDLQADPSTPSGYRWSSSSGPNHDLRPGDTLDVDFTVEHRTLLGLVIPPLARFLTPSMPVVQ
jgi:HlyD family secretion protein